ncbi:MAG: hypothetical protein FWG40_02440 [Peptococcaceae bacterium]|nr:hypothetical protein [Peptococcaceae bacterium]
MEPTVRIYQAYTETLNAVLQVAGTRSLSRPELYNVSQTALETIGTSFLPVLLADAAHVAHNRNVKDNTDSNRDTGNEFNPDHLKRAWVKTVLIDIRVRLLVSHDVLVQVGRDLKDIKPLFETKTLSPFRPTGGDPFEDTSYLKIMQTLVMAWQDRQTVRLRYADAQNNEALLFQPLRFEYNAGTDRFLVRGNIAENDTVHSALDIGIRDITDIRLSLKTRSVSETPPSLNEEAAMTPTEPLGIPRNAHFEDYLLIPPQEPLIVEISGGRNAFERFRRAFMETDKRRELRTEFDQTSRSYTCMFSYKPQDEDNVVSRLLNLTPPIRVLSPLRLARQIGLRRLSR